MLRWAIGLCMPIWSYIATCSQGSVIFWNGHNCLVQCVREAEKTNKHVHEIKLR